MAGRSLPSPRAGRVQPPAQRPHPRSAGGTCSPHYACQVDTARGELGRAEKGLPARASRCTSATGGRAHPHWLLSSLANLYRRRGRYDEAFTLLRQTLNVLEKSSAPNIRAPLRRWPAWAICSRRRAHPEVVDYTQRALAIYRKTSRRETSRRGNESPDPARAGPSSRAV